MVNEQNSKVRPIFREETPDVGEPAGIAAGNVQYEFSGEEPIILPDEQGEHEGFSAWTYSDHSVQLFAKHFKIDIWKHKHFIRKQ